VDGRGTTYRLDVTKAPVAKSFVRAKEIVLQGTVA
jgi:hypothetical protein